MEFNFDIQEILPSCLTVVEPKNHQNSQLSIYDLENREEKCWFCNPLSNLFCDSALTRKKENLETLIDNIGYASAQAQDLLSPITTFKKLFGSSNQKLYLMRDDSSVIGLLRIGQKRLFLCDDSNTHREIDATCILDFYIHESKQRCGFGHKLFEVMLQNENTVPEKLAIDRPSLKFLSFLSKHYYLKDPKLQANNFVVYSGFFENKEMSEASSKQNFFSQNNSLSDSNFNNQGMHAVPISKEIKNSCTRNIDGNLGIDGYFKKKRLPSECKSNGISSLTVDQKSWGVYDALHSYCENDNFSDQQRTSYSQCSTSPANTVNARKQQKWNQLQSSWNVLGVKPLDYSKIGK